MQTEEKIVYGCKLFIKFSVSPFFSLFMTRIYITALQSHVEGCWAHAEKANFMVQSSWGALHCWCKSYDSHCIYPGECLPPGFERLRNLFIFIRNANLFWRLLIYAFLMIYFDYEFWWLIPGFCVLCSRHFWENTLKIHLLILQKNQWKLFSMLTIINSYLTGPQNMKKTGNKGFFSLLHTSYLCRHSHCKLCLMHMQ